MKVPYAFVQALKKRSISCSTPGCSQPVSVEENSQPEDRIKSFELHCEQCGERKVVTGELQVDPPWDEGAMIEIMEEHLLHLEPVCPYDQAPVHFQSLPNPRRRARYHIACFFCGREETIDWPPEESKR